MKTGAIITIAIASLAVAPRAFAQQFEPPTPPTVATPPVQVSFEALYNTNVAASDAALAAERGLKQGDWRFTPDVALNLTHQFGPESVFLTGDAGYDFYDRDTVLNRERINLAAGGTGQVGRCTGTLTGGYDVHQTSLDDFNIIGPTVKNTQQYDSIAFNGACSGAIGLGPQLSVTRAWQTNSETQYKEFNYQQFTVTGSLVYQRPVFGKLSGFVQYDESQYPNEIIGPNLRGDHYDLIAGGVRFERDIGARIGVTASIAYTHLAPYRAPTFQSLSYRGDAHYNVTGKLELLVSASRNLQPALLNESSYLLNELYSAELDYRATSRMTFAVGGSIEHRHYGAPIGVESLFLTDSQMHDLYATARREFGRRFYVALETRYEVRHADEVEFNYNSARFGVTLGAHF